MDSDSAVSVSSPLPHSSEDYDAAVGEGTPDPEEYETASDPDVDDTDTTAAMEDALSPESSVLKSSSETGDQENVSFDKGDVLESGRNGILPENSDFDAGGKYEREEEENISSGIQNLVGVKDSSGGDVAKSRENGVGESQVESEGNLGGDNEQSDLVGTEISKASEPTEPESSVTTMDPDTSESGAIDSTSPLNQNGIGEVGDDVHQGFDGDAEGTEKPMNLEGVVPMDGDVLEDNHVEAKPYVDGAKISDSIVADSTVSEPADAGRELEVVVDKENKPVNPEKFDATVEDGSEGSSGEISALKDEALEFISIDSNEEFAGKNLAENPKTENFDSVKSTADNCDQVYLSGSGERSYSLNEESADNKELGGLEDASDPSEGGNLSEIAKGAGVVDENTKGTTTENHLQESVADKVERKNIIEITEESGIECVPQTTKPDKPDYYLPNLETAKEEVVGLENAHSSSVGEPTAQSNVIGGDLNSSIDVETNPISSKVTPVGDDNTQKIATETLSQKDDIDEKKAVVDLEGASSSGIDEPAVQLNVVDGDLNSSEDVETLPFSAKGTVVRDETTQTSTTKSPPQKSNTDEEKVVVVLEGAPSSGIGEPAIQSNVVDGDLNSSICVETNPISAAETVVGEGSTQDTITENLPQRRNTGNDKVEVGIEDTPRSDEGKPAVQINEVDGDFNSTVEVNTLPIITKKTVDGDKNTKETITKSFHQKNNTDKLENTYIYQQIAEDKVGVGSDNTCSHGERKPALQFTANVGETNPSMEVDTLSVIASKETVVRDESLPEIHELDQKVVTNIGGSQVTAPEKDKNEDGYEDRTISEGSAAGAKVDGPKAAKQVIKEMERISSTSQFRLQSSRDYSTSLDGQVVSDSDEVLDSDEDGDGGELFDSAALAALLKAATGSSDGTVTVTAQDAARIFSSDRPVGLGMSAPSLRPAAPRSTRPSLFTPSEIAAVEELDHSMDDDEKRLHEKVDRIRVKFLRLVHRLGHSPADAVVEQVLYRLSLAEGLKQRRQMNRTFDIKNAKRQALQLEEEGRNDLDFSCNILVLGKTGVGKSATINSIFGEEMSHTDPFHQATASVREISGVIDGVKIRVIDTPGLKASIMDQATNRKFLSSIKKFTKKCPPDIVLYVDRMDTQSRDFNDMPLLKSITSILGSSIWFNAIIALTHAASAPPDGPNGSPLGYEGFVTQRSHVVQQSVKQAAGDMRLMNPVALVENHPSCRRNREGERILPNGLSWRPQLLLLSYASKILSDANSLLKLQDPSSGKLFGGFRLRSPPLPFLLSSLLQTRAHPKLSGDHGGDNADSDVDLDEFSDTEQDEEVDEYDQLPPFKPLKKSQISKLTKEQKKAYFDEYDYRVKLLQKKQWKEELRRLKETKKKGMDGPDEFTNGVLPDDYDQDGSPAAVQVPLPDMVLPPSFDCDNPAFRYRFLEPTSQLLTRPVLDTHGWDHDCGYDGVSIEESLAIANQFPTSMALQITKDKKEFNIHLDSSVAFKHGEHGSTLAGFDIQSVGKQLAYILRGETKFDKLKKNKAAAGVSVTFLGETVATGLKVEDRISIGKRVGLVGSTGAVRAQGDVAYGANLEVRLKDKDYPIGQALSTLGLSLMKWRNDLALGANLQSQFSICRNSKMAVRVGLNNKLTGQITVRTSTSDQLHIAFAGIIPLAISIYRSIKSNDSYMDH